MKRTYFRSAIATVGIIAGTLSLHAQAGGGAGGGAGAGAAGGSAGGAVSGATGARATGAGSPAAAGTLGTAGRAGARASTTRGLNTAGAASITQPATTPPAGGVNPLGQAQNTIGGSPSGNTILAAPGGASSVTANSTLPGVGLNQQTIPVTSLPSQVQTALTRFGGNATLDNVTQVQGANGPIYRASIVQNGVPVQYDLSANGQILARTVSPASVNPANTLTTPGTVLGNVTTPGTVGNVNTAATVGTAGSTLGTAGTVGVTGSTLPGSIMLFGELPPGVQTAVRSQTGNGQIMQIARNPNANATSAYLVRYDLNGQPMLLTLGPNGQVLSNRPFTATGAAPGTAVGTGRASSPTPGAGATGVNTNNATGNNNRTSMQLDELPDPVHQTLQNEARYAEVRSITREKRVGGDVYLINLRGENNVGELTIDSEGKVLNDTRLNFADLSIPKTNNIDDEIVTGMPFAKVPKAIQNAVKAYAAAGDIRSIILDRDATGKTIYDVVYYKDGRRDRMIVEKDGTVQRIDQNVPPIFEKQEPGNPPAIAISDLPEQVRDTIRRETDNVMVKQITTEKVGPKLVYVAHYQNNGQPVQLMVAPDGKVVLPQGSPEEAHAGSPLPAPVSKTALANAEIVRENPEPISAHDSGTAARAETGGSTDAVVTSSGPDDHPTSEVSLKDVPAPVQSAAKRLAAGAEIQSIAPKLGDSGVAYQVTFGTNETEKTVTLNKDGVILPEKK